MTCSHYGRGSYDEGRLCTFTRWAAHLVRAVFRGRETKVWQSLALGCSSASLRRPTPASRHGSGQRARANSQSVAQFAAAAEQPEPRACRDAAHVIPWPRCELGPRASGRQLTDVCVVIAGSLTANRPPLPGVDAAPFHGYLRKYLGMEY